MITCKEAGILTEKRLSEKIPFSDKFQLKLHLAMCKLCARYNLQSKWLDKVLRNLTADERFSEAEKIELKKNVKESHS